METGNGALNALVAQATKSENFREDLAKMLHRFKPDGLDTFLTAHGEILNSFRETPTYLDSVLDGPDFYHNGLSNSMRPLLLNTKNGIFNFLVNMLEDGHVDTFVYQLSKFDPNDMSVVLQTKVNGKPMSEHIKTLRDTKD
jgi:hypothetical protein